MRLEKVNWYESDEIPEIPADVLARLDAARDPGDCGDVAEVERERSAMRRVVSINQQLRWKLVELQTDLHTANTHVDSLKIQVQDLVRRLQRMGYEASHKPPAR